jgi:hypothetical protein
MKIILTLLCAAFLCGCETTQQYTVKIESDPPGAHVYMSATASPKKASPKHPAYTGARNFLGTTPCTASITGDGEGYFKLPKIIYMSKYVGGQAVFTAEPPSSETNLFTQTIIFHGNTKYANGDKIPTGIFFDMHKPASE